MLGSFLALDLVLFFVFFEVALIPMWFVIAGWGDAHDEPGRRRAATRFLVFTVLGSALMLVGFLLVRVAGRHLRHRADRRDRTGPPASPGSPRRCWSRSASAVKTPLWPLHIWLPDAHTKAPTVGSVVLAGGAAQAGHLRPGPVLAAGGRPALAAAGARSSPGLAVVGIVYGRPGLPGADRPQAADRLLQRRPHGLRGARRSRRSPSAACRRRSSRTSRTASITGLLFFLAGAIKDRYGTGDLGRLSVLYGTVAAAGGAVRVRGDGLASACPGLAGFWGEMLAIRSALYAGPALPVPTYAVLAVIAALGVILTSAYFLQLLRGMLQGTPAAVRPVNEDVASIELATAEVDPGTTTAGAVRADVDTAGVADLVAAGRAHPRARCRARARCSARSSAAAAAFFGGSDDRPGHRLGGGRRRRSSLAVGALVVLLVDAFAGPPRSRRAALVPATLTVLAVARRRRVRGRGSGTGPAPTFCVVRPLDGPAPCSFVVDRFTLVFWARHAVRHGGRRADRHRGGRRGPHAAGGVELPAALLGDRRAGARRLPRPGHAGGRARGGVPAGLRDDRPAHAATRGPPRPR